MARHAVHTADQSRLGTPQAQATLSAKRPSYRLYLAPWGSATIHCAARGALPIARKTAERDLTSGVRRPAAKVHSCTSPRASRAGSATIWRSPSRRPAQQPSASPAHVTLAAPHTCTAPLVAHVDNLIAADAWRTTATYRSIPEELSPMSLQPTLVGLPSGEDLLVVTRRYPSSRDLPLLIVSLNTDAPARPIFDADLLGVLPARPGQEAPLLLLTFTPLTLPQRTVISVARLNGEIVSSCEGTPPHLVRMAGAEWLALGASFVRIPKLDDTVPLPPRLRDARIEVAEICNNVADGAERLCVVVWTSASDEWTPCEPDEGVSRV